MLVERLQCVVTFGYSLRKHVYRPASQMTDEPYGCSKRLIYKMSTCPKMTKKLCGLSCK